MYELEFPGCLGVLYFYGALICMYEIYFPPVDLSNGNLILRPAKEPRREEGESISSQLEDTSTPKRSVLSMLFQSCNFYSVVLARRHFILPCTKEFSNQYANKL